MEQYTPTLISAGIGLLIIVALAALLYGIKYLRTQSKNKTIQWLAELAYSKAERAGETYLSGKDDKGTAKFEEAVQALTDMLAARRIKVDPAIIVNSVQWAWQRLEGTPKAQGTIIKADVTATSEQMETAAEQAIHKVLER